MNPENPPQLLVDAPQMASANQQMCFVLVETSHPGNVGAAARALKTMGFARLVLVNPKDPHVLQHPEAIAMASGADDVLAHAQVVDSLSAALAEVTLSIAMTARLREYGPQRLLPRHAAAQLSQAVQGGQQVALVFGNERFGLPNEAVEQCSFVTHIPANPAYSSLNLAQAVQLMAWEVRMQQLEGGSSASLSSQAEIGFVGEAATQGQIEGMYQHLEEALVAIEFLDPDSPKKLMTRVRRLFSRTRLELEEVNILRGIATKILRQQPPKA